MPYVYPVEMRDSPIQGKGLFALQDIPKGAVYWVFHVNNPIPIKGVEIKENRVYSREELEAITDSYELNSILQGGLYLKDNDAFLVFHDGSEFMNHCFRPNSQIVYPQSKDYRELVSYAIWDIKAGEEIFENYENYSSFNAEWLANLMEKFNNSRIWFEDAIRKSPEAGFKQ
jgi:SET domain-containing protein